MKILRAFAMCMSMFTALPCPWKIWDEDARELMTACLPLTGALLGGLWYAFTLLGRTFLPEALCTALTAALPFLLTGFMHLDGFMDSADALLSWRPLEKRREILKDVHCGSFSVVSVVLLMIGMFAAASEIGSIDPRHLILIPATSRCLSAFCVTALKPVGHSEYAALRRDFATPAVSLAMLLITFLIGAFWAGSILPLACVVVAYACAMYFAFRTMQGVSGDLAGYALCVGELCGLAAMSVF